MGKKIGIDLGTTYSCMSYVDDYGILQIIKNLEGELTTPSVVFFPESGEPIVGSTARQEGKMAPERLIERVKNYMGDPNFQVTYDGQNYSASAISAAIIHKLVTDAKNFLGDDIEGAIITCPAYFDDSQRAATRVAGEAIGLNVFSILDEPVAAGLAYSNSRQEDMKKTVLIYDLGGGTFDCTILKFDFQGTTRRIGQINTGGDHMLGGKDWDAILTDYVCNEFVQKKGGNAQDMSEDYEMIAWFSENIEKAKKALTSTPKTVLTVSYEGQREKIEITQETFENLTSGLLQKTILKIEEMMNQVNLTVERDIDEIILVGGSTKMPQVRKKLEQLYGKPISSYEPDEAVARGAALVANDVNYVQPVQSDTGTDGTIPEGQSGGYQLSGASGEIETKNEKTGTTTIVDVICTKTYGIQAINEKGQQMVSNLILKCTPKPAHTVGDFFSTSVPNQTTLQLQVYESNSVEQEIAPSEGKQMYETCAVTLDPGLPQGAPITIIFDLNQDGALVVTAIDETRGKSTPVIMKRIGEDESNAGMDAMKNRLSLSGN